MHIIKATPVFVLLLLGCTVAKIPIYQPTAEGGLGSYDYCPAYSSKSAAVTFSHAWGKVFIAFVQNDTLANMGAFGAVRVGAQSSQEFSLYISDPLVQINGLKGDLLETTFIPDSYIGPLHQKPTQWAPASVSVAALVKGPLPSAFLINGPTIIVNNETIMLQDIYFEIEHKRLQASKGC